MMKRTPATAMCRELPDKALFHPNSQTTDNVMNTSFDKRKTDQDKARKRFRIWLWIFTLLWVLVSFCGPWLVCFMVKASEIVCDLLSLVHLNPDIGQNDETTTIMQRWHCIGAYGSAFNWLTAYITGLAFIGLLRSIKLQSVDLKYHRQALRNQGEQFVKSLESVSKQNQLLTQQIGLQKDKMKSYETMSRQRITSSSMFDYVKLIHQREKDLPNGISLRQLYDTLKKIIYSIFPPLFEEIIDTKKKENDLAEAIYTIRRFKSDLAELSLWRRVFTSWYHFVNDIMMNEDKEQIELYQKRLWHLFPHYERVLLRVQIAYHHEHHTHDYQDEKKLFDNEVCIKSFIVGKEKEFRLLELILAEEKNALTNEELQAMIARVSKS